jgi:hypothetical protein
MISAFIWIPAALLGAWVGGGYLTVRNVPMNKYAVVAQKDGYEIRQYEPYILAETPMQDESGNSGFRELFAYISGANTGQAKLAMTVPVLQSGREEGKKLAMTAPVLQTQGEAGALMAFVMPPGLKFEDLPRPTSAKVTLRAVPGKKIAALRFAGWGSRATVQKKTRRLQAALERDGLRPAAAPVTAFYNPPFTAPFMRRNEVLIELQ